MNLESIKQLARAEMPRVPVRTVPGSHRHDVVAPLQGQANVGIELGVAAGIFSARMVQSGRFAQFFGVDVYGDLHDTTQYKEALRRVGLLAPYKLLRMTFDDAAELFDEAFFDFIYVDGYAHTGEEGGETLLKWYRKLKPGGVMAGDDYHPDWPLVQWAVNDFVRQLGVELMVTERTEDRAYCAYPSWFFVKPAVEPQALVPCARLLEIGQAEKRRIAAERSRGPDSRARRELVGLLDRVGLKEPIKRLIGR